MEILNIKNLTFKYPQNDSFALDDVSLGVNSGELVLFLGASGSGKTTLLRLLKPEIAPWGEQSGEICIKEDLVVAMVSQDVENQIVSDTVWHNLAFGLESMNKSSSEIRRKVAEIAEFFDITHLYFKNTFELSGGEKQLVNLASVMVLDPDILLLDEPTSQLDPIAARRFIDTVKRLNEEMGLTVLISEHCHENIWQSADRVCILDNGKLLYNGNRDNAYASLGDFIELPKGVELYNKLNIGGKCPVTVSECRNFLSENFKNDIAFIHETSENKPIALQLKDLFFRYQKKAPDVLKKLTISFNFGEITTILGGNGSGKTTLLSIISGINKPYDGKIKSHGMKIGVLPQNVKAVFTKDTLYEDLALITEDFNEITDRLSLNEFLKRNPYDLSGGEAQRAALAKILLTKPDILCLDEPTKGIDAKGKRDIEKILKELASEGVCIIVVTHDADFAAEISDKCAFMFGGQIVSEGLPGEVFSTNKFYTTFASRISRHMYKNTVTIDKIVQLCKRNGRY